ncbi:MAG: haloacid dehalogenase [Gammaproteobacteria bacterium]|nr:MAG: haloacid dehalogenase [Gammaproteobacteria bacterium]
MINWREIDTVLLDMDGTLLDLHFDNYFWQQQLPDVYVASQGRDDDTVRAELNKLFADTQGTLNWYSLDYWSEQLGLDIVALKREIRHRIQIRPFTEQFLQHLQQGPQEVLLVTNAHRDTVDLKMEQVPIAHYFDHLVISHDLAAPKEQQDFWHALMKLHPFNPDRTLFIDDTLSVLQAAQDFGIAHLLTLTQPDSQQQRRLDTQFPSIHHFDEIMPPLAQPERVIC